MANTYTLISSVTVGSGGASSITFSNIPQTYTDLCLVTSLRSNNSGATWAGLIFNGSATNFTSRNVLGTGSAVNSQTVTDYIYVSLMNSSADTANTFSSTSIYIPNYTSSNYKSWSSDTVRENNTTSAEQFMWGFLYSNTNAITSIQLYLGANNFVQYSTAYLYGIKNS